MKVILRPTRQSEIAHKLIRGFLEMPCVLRDGNNIGIIPAGTQVEIHSNDNWYHETSLADIAEAQEILKRFGRQLKRE